MTPFVQVAADAIKGEVLIRASPEQVFRALIAPEELMAWWGSKDTYRVTAAIVELHEGGAWVLDTEDERGRSFRISAEIIRLNPPHLLQLSWATSWMPDLRSTVEIRLTPEGSATRLSVEHSGLPGPGTGGRDTHVLAWKSILAWAQEKIQDRDGAQA